MYLPIVNKAKHLYVIGNGFDLHHNINSSYTDFHQWLHDNYWEIYMKIDEVYGYCDSNWWADFENQLGSLDVVQYSTSVAAQNQPDLLSEHCDGMWDDAQIAVEQELDGLYSNLRDCFHEWIMQLNSPLKSRMIDFEDNSIYINFNYTKTLEEVYNISSNHIWHIHGCIDDENEDLVLGHGKAHEDLKQTGSLVELEFHEGLALETAISSVAAQAKPVKNIIETNQTFFDSLLLIERIHIYGLSLSDVDLPYLALLAQKAPNAEWEFSDYKNKNHFKIEQFVKANNITNYKIIQLEDVMHRRQLKINLQ